MADRPALESPEGWAWPPGTAWAWRADLSPGGAYLWPGVSVVPGEAIAPELKVFHEGAAPAALVLPHSGGFALCGTARAGAFVSLVIDLTVAGRDGLTGRSLLSVVARATLSAPREMSARVNLRHGPNTTQQSRPLRLRDGLLIAEFDLAYTDIAHATLTGAWIDLLIERPDGAVLSLTDLTLSHRPRAEP